MSQHTPRCPSARTLLSAVMLALAPSSRPAHAQVPDLLEVSAQYLPSAALEEPRPTEVQVSSYDAAVNLP